MQFQSYKIADLIPASYNPRKKLKPGDKEYEKIKNSIKEFGYVEPIIINSDMSNCIVLAFLFAFSMWLM